MYEHRTAYRHDDGSIEGFVGAGGTKAKAQADALTQIMKKLDIMSDGEDFNPSFDKANLVTSPSRLSPADLDAVQKDWRSGLRY